MEERGAERASNVGTALAPVKTGVGEAAALGAGLVEVEAEAGEGAGSILGKRVGIRSGYVEAGWVGATLGTAAAGALDPARTNEAVVERDGNGSGHVVVAGARGAEMFGGARNKAAARSAGEDAEALKGAGDAGPGEGVVAMPALHEDADQIFRFETGEVNAGGRGGDIRDNGELGSGTGVAVHEGVEHAGAGRLTDGGGDGGDGGVGIADCIHALTVNEVWMRGKDHAAGYGSGQDYSARGNCGRGGRGVRRCLAHVGLRNKSGRGQSNEGRRQDDEGHMLYPVADRSISERGVQEVRGELGTDHSAMWRPFGGIFSAA